MSHIEWGAQAKNTQVSLNSKPTPLTQPPPMDLLIQNLVSPVVLAFALGMIARWVKSDLEIPAQIYSALSIYLLFAIGLKGGVALSQTPINELIGPLGMTLLLGVATPFSAYFLLRSFGKLGRVDAGATAAHYGSVSAVTFLAALLVGKATRRRGRGRRWGQPQGSGS